jgi:hypothetical protein
MELPITPNCPFIQNPRTNKINLTFHGLVP